MTTRQDKQTWFMIEFSVSGWYGALICERYVLTEHTASRHITPVYECQKIHHMAIGPLISGPTEYCSLEAIRVRRVRVVEDKEQAIQEALRNRGSSTDTVQYTWETQVTPNK